ncbi:helix-turn-helix domain-containing protein [uncultured Corynebacterium sp.]|uniref:helix-turn-helix transcriptional regulator n=1 Tax=uncultured Corynebacterium sp. TaxID=159447 RepID=UPI0025EC7ACA|nr:helix-turn-helix domain-containing protein [uncultured Corynebacterium sp.]
MTTLPRSSTELFPEALRLSPKQREVLSTLQTFPQGARAAQLADALDMHVNTARGHLDELVRVGAVRVITAPAKGRGRPSLIFQVRIPDNRSIAEEYVALINLMAEMLAGKEELGSYGSEQAREIGARWAQTTAGHNDENMDPLAPLCRTMRDMGFDPTMSLDALEKNGTADMELHACPFVAAGVHPTPFVCAVHDGFLAETARVSMGGKLQLKLVPKAGNAMCRVQVTKTSA